MGDVNPNGTGDFEICVVNRDGTGLHRLTDTPGENTQPDWSPDGQRIAFESIRLGWPSLPSVTPAGYDPATFGDEDVWVMRNDGSEQRNLTLNPLEDDSFPAWSPDGSWIVFSRYGNLRVVSSDDNEGQSVPNSPGTDGFPDWIAEVERP
jgi:Tol biopolymer transport system component